MNTKVLKQKINTATSLTVSSLHSLADSAVNGWQSALISNLTTQATDYLIAVDIRLSGAPVLPKAIYVYLCPAFYDGSAWILAASGTASSRTTTEGTITVTEPHNLRLMRVLNYTTSGGAASDIFLVSETFGPAMPDGFQVMIFNDSGVALAGSGSKVWVRPINLKQI